MSLVWRIRPPAGACAALHSGAVDRTSPKAAPGAPQPGDGRWARTARGVCCGALARPCECASTFHVRCPQHHRHAALSSASTSVLPALAAARTQHLHRAGFGSRRGRHVTATSPISLASSSAPRCHARTQACSGTRSAVVAQAAGEAGPAAEGSTAQPARTTAPPAAGPAAAHHPQLTSGLGQVIAASSNFVRVQLYTLLPDSEPTPPGWRPPHMRDRGADGCAAAGDPASLTPQGQDSGAGNLATAAMEAATAAAIAAEQPANAGTGTDTGTDTDTGGAGASSCYPVLLCSLRSLLRKLRQDVVVGDVVRVEAVDWVAGRGAVSEVLPRSSRLTDPAVANVEHALLVFALDTPPFEEQQVSRFLVAYEAAGVPFSLVLNKADLVPRQVLEARLAQCRAWGYEPVVLSCETGEGVEQVAARLSDRVSVVAGPSGAGKSSLINLLRRGRHRPDLQSAPGAAAANAAEQERALAELERAEAEAEDEAAQAAQAEAEMAAAAGGEAGQAAQAKGRGGRAAAGEERQPMPIGGVQELVKLPPPSVLGLQLGLDTSGGSGGTGSDAAASADSDGSAVASTAAAGGGGVGSGVSGREPEFLAVGALSKMGRGMHTTTSISLLRLLGGGWLADTPGFGQPTLDDISSPQLAACFPEIADLVEAQPCRFADCLHVAEPGCAVRGAGLERYGFYLRFLQDIRAREANDVTRLQRARADRQGYAKAKSVRGGGERLEARLDSKRHRRTSRQSGRRAGDLD